jgi:hypothetical protein
MGLGQGWGANRKAPSIMDFIVNEEKKFKPQRREDAKLGLWRFFIVISNSFILLALRLCALAVKKFQRIELLAFVH